jgi:mRNA interferase MazF
MSNQPKRGDIYWVSLDPTRGTEVNKTRPALILSNNSSNHHSSRVIIGPITRSVDKVYPFEVKINMPKGIISKVMLDQVRCVDKMRLGQKIHAISHEEMLEVDKALKVTFALH